MGVPVIASLNGALRSRAHWWMREVWFLANCASSRMSPAQSTEL